MADDESSGGSLITSAVATQLLEITPPQFAIAPAGAGSQPRRATAAPSSQSP